MADEQKKSEKRSRFSKLDIAIILLIILILLSVAIPTVIHYYRVGQAREVLGNAKSACLATQVVSYDYYRDSHNIVDEKEDSKLAVGVPDQIRELAQVKGELYRVKISSTTNKVLSMTYVENGYAVNYVMNPKDDESKWNVYRLEHMISD